MLLYSMQYSTVPRYTKLTSTQRIPRVNSFLGIIFPTHIPRVTRQDRLHENLYTTHVNLAPSRILLLL
jgi:hypothetical protein